MSFINGNLFGTGLGPTGAFSEFGSGGTTGSGGALPQLPPALDQIQSGNYSPFEGAVLGAGGACGTSGGGLNFGSFMNSIGNLISNMLAQLGSAINGLTSGSQPGSQSGAPGAGDTYFTNANASSTGDPHDAFNGTTGSGSNIDEKWNSMRSHGDLLSSNSFAGDYRVSTQVTQPNTNGVTYNQSATVTTGGGATNVSMQASGAYAVTENGHAVSLVQGQATSLGNGETVTLNADGSLTVADANADGGSISTTLKSNGDGGVDVSNTATDVDLGGYLVHQSDGGYNPGATTSGSYTGSYPGVNPSPFSYGNAPQPPAISGLEQFDPDSADTSVQNIELA
jgi:hypothetical protein